jgi:hypothetical protein
MNDDHATDYAMSVLMTRRVTETKTRPRTSISYEARVKGSNGKPTDWPSEPRHRCQLRYRRSHGNGACSSQVPRRPCSKTRPRLEQVAAKIIEKSGEALVVQADIRFVQEAKRAVRETLEAFRCAREQPGRHAAGACQGSIAGRMAAHDETATPPLALSQIPHSRRLPAGDTRHLARASLQRCPCHTLSLMVQLRGAHTCLGRPHPEPSHSPDLASVESNFCAPQLATAQKTPPCSARLSTDLANCCGQGPAPPASVAACSHGDNAQSTGTLSSPWSSR